MALQHVKEFRRKLMKSLTKNLSNPTDEKYDPALAIKRVLIARPNQRLGNLLLATPLVAEVQRLFPGCEVDIFVKGGLGPIVFKNYGVRKFHSLPKKPFSDFFAYIKVWKSLKNQNYDLAINVDHDSASGRIAVKITNARFSFFGQPDLSSSTNQELHIAKYPVANLRNYLKNIGFPVSDAPIDKIDIRLSEKELALGKQTLDRVIGSSRPTLSIFTYATGTKCYSKVWWIAFYERLKMEFPNHNIIEILPVENVSQIDFKANTFYSKDVRAIGAVMTNTAAYIGADSGIMHLASASMATTVGLFSVTSSKKYAPYGNCSVGINTDDNNLDAVMLEIHRAISLPLNKFEVREPRQ